MDAFDSIREAAAKLHRAVAAKQGNDLSPLQLVNAVASERQLKVFPLAKGDPALKGARATFDEQTGGLCYEKCANDTEAALLVAHEIGHEVLHAGTAVCSSNDIDPTRSTETAPVGLQRVEDYGAKERRELQADVFARELLLPRENARKMHVDEQLGATAIAARTSLPLNLVRQQLLDALLLVPTAKAQDSATETFEPDPSQQRAASHRGSPFLLQAGPGTGKTKTLVMRVLSLLKEGIDPCSILVLTFSNRAAGELSERITKAAPDAGPKIWIGTFHAFGLDLVRRFHDRLKLPTDPKLFDRTDSIEILEGLLPTLPLVHFKNLWDPTMVLCDVLSGISRAKDEMVEPAGYKSLAEAMSKAAVDDDSKAAGGKCLEVAKIYDLYEEMLRNNEALDFGDLIMRPALLLESDELARKLVQLRHRHILVDEYQDVNRASARLLKALAGNGEHLWVVGDARQSIYRFRGASTANMVKFSTDYPGAKTDQLELNYRSTTEIVDTFVSCTPRMKASTGMLPLALKAKRGSSGTRPEVRRYDHSDTELAGIAANVRELEGKGIPLRSQVVLCRGNERVNEVAAALESRDIPVLHLGSFFEREEIRDLLALLSIVVDPHADGLVRVGACPRYGMSLQDVYAATKACRDSQGSALESLSSVESSPEVSASGKASIRKLIQDFAGVSVASTPWEVLCGYILDRTDLGREITNGATVKERMRALAVWQLFNFIREQSPAGKGLPIRRVLDRVRRLVLLAEERDLRQVPAAALDLNAVRLMTVHGSKGLEFDAVHLPGLNSTAFPLSYRGQRCPAPTGLVDGDDPKTSHEAEEECLFFVALSRARTHLRLTLCQKQKNGNKRSPSAFLAWLKVGALSEIASPATIYAASVDSSVDQITIVRTAKISISDQFLASYSKCPRRFFYTHVIGLRGAALPTPFSRTQGCLFRAFEWLSGARAGATPTLVDLETAFEAIWQEHGPKDHGLATDYRKLASRLLSSLMAAAAGRTFREVVPLAVNLANGSVVVQPSEIAELKDGTVVIRRVRTGHKRSDEYDRLEYTLYVSATAESYGSSAQVEAVHLADNLVEDVEITDKKLANRRATAEEMLNNISLGLFPAVAEQRSCPRCPHFFLCPATPAGKLTLP